MSKTPSATPETKTPQSEIAPGSSVAMMPWSVGVRMATTWLEGATRMNGELARFTADRLQKDAETQHEIFTCGSPLEAQRLQSEFMHRAVEDYLTEVARITAMSNRVAQDAGIET